MFGAIIGDIVGSLYEIEEVNAIKNTPEKKEVMKKELLF